MRGVGGYRLMRWDGAPQITPAPMGVLGVLRACQRGAAILLVIGFGFLTLLLCRVPERVIAGPLCRPITARITQIVCVFVCVILGLKVTRQGNLAQGAGAIVANHVSWLDILPLNAGGPVVFVAKSEVRDWAGIGILARGAGTFFIERRRMAAKDQNRLLHMRLAEGAERLVFFPEGTSTDGLRVLPFRSSLFEAFFAAELPGDMTVQPVTIAYHAPAGESPAFYGWWGDQSFGAGLMRVLSVRKNGHAAVIYHAPLRVSEFASRKALAQAAEKAVRAGLLQALSPEGTEVS